MRLALSIALLLATCGASAIASAAKPAPKPEPAPPVPVTDAPNLKSLKKYSENGVSMQLPGNWTVTNSIPNDGTGGVLSIEADKEGLESIGLDVIVQIFPADQTGSNEDLAKAVYERQVEGSTNYSKPVIKPFTLGGGHPAIAQRYEHKIFTNDRPYAHRLDLIASKPCGKEWVCLIFSQTLQVNEQSASIGMGKIYETVKYAP